MNATISAGMSLLWTAPYILVPSGAGTFSKLSGEVSVLKWKIDVHSRNKTGLLLELTLVYLLSLCKYRELNKNLEVLES